MYNENMIKPTIKEKLISLLYAVIMLGLMALLCLVCIKEQPLWVVTCVLFFTIFWLVCGILLGRPAPITDDKGNTVLLSGKDLKKDRKNLLIGGLFCGCVWVGVMLWFTTLSLSDKTLETLKMIGYSVPILSFLVGLGIRYLIKR